MLLSLKQIAVGMRADRDGILHAQQHLNGQLAQRNDQNCQMKIDEKTENFIFRAPRIYLFRTQVSLRFEHLFICGSIHLNTHNNSFEAIL